MAKYYIDYHTGAGNKWVEGTLEDAMKIADEGIAYTQQDIVIENENRKVVAYRGWWNVPYDYDLFNERETDVIQFGELGHYSAWTTF